MRGRADERAPVDMRLIDVRRVSLNHGSIDLMKPLDAERLVRGIEAIPGVSEVEIRGTDLDAAARDVHFVLGGEAGLVMLSHRARRARLVVGRHFEVEVDSIERLIDELGDWAIGRLPVLAFSRDGELLVFDSMRAAAGWLESIDVLDGEYEAAFSADGRVIELRGRRNARVEVRATGAFDHDELVRRLASARERFAFSADPRDPMTVAAEILEAEQRRRHWPWHRRS